MDSSTDHSACARGLSVLLQSYNCRPARLVLEEEQENYLKKKPARERALINK
jgi:hypothetical protein